MLHSSDLLDIIFKQLRRCHNHLVTATANILNLAVDVQHTDEPKANCYLGRKRIRVPLLRIAVDITPATDLVHTVFDGAGDVNACGHLIDAVFVLLRDVIISFVVKSPADELSLVIDDADVLPSGTEGFYVGC